MKAHKDEIDKLLKDGGYKFLGWENGGMTQKTEEWKKCYEMKHQIDEVQHSHRGSENTVSCDICKIYWKYDCSD